MNNYSVLTNKYFQHLLNIKFHELYGSIYQDYSFKWDNVINWVTALASSSSVAAWAIWNNENLKIVWLCIIALSNIINAVRPLLPYKKRVNSLASYTSLLRSIYNEYDYHWFKISQGEYSEDEVNDLLLKMREQNRKADDEYILNNYFPIKGHISKKANMRIERYVKIHYGIEPNVKQRSQQ